MLGILLLAFLLIPIVELYLFVQVSQAIGFWAALFWIVAVSFIGAWLVKREGMGALTRANAKVARGQLPTDELISGILIVFGGALMLTPGFLTDAVGLLLVFPPTRTVAGGALRSRFATSGPILIGGRFSGGRFSGGRGAGGPGAGGPEASGRDDVWDADSWEDPPDRRGLG